MGGFRRRPVRITRLILSVAPFCSLAGPQIVRAASDPPLIPTLRREVALIDLAPPVVQQPSSREAASEPASGEVAEEQRIIRSAKNLQITVEAIPEAAPPGGVVTLHYTVDSFEESDERVRIRVLAAEGWTATAPEEQQSEWMVPATDAIEGRIDLLVPQDAAVDSRHLVRLIGEVIGEPGVIEGRTYVSVVGRSRSTPNTPRMSASSTVGLSRVGGSVQDAQSLTALQLSTSVGRTSVSFSYQQGVLDTLSNYRYDVEPRQITGIVRAAGWEINFGNRLPSTGNSLTGPFANAVGASLKRARGALIADLTVGQPARFGEEAAGHLVRGRAGLKGRKGFVALAISDFGRPDGGYTTLAPVQQIPLDADAEEQLEIEREFTARAPSNRVQGAGMEIEFRPVRGHRFTARTGALRLSNSVGERSTSAVGEAAYSWTASRRATLNVRWREMPQTLSGLYIFGDERTVDGALRLTGSWRLVGRGFENSSETFGRAIQSRSAGGSTGLSYARDAWQVEARWNHRQSQFRERTVRRTVSVNGAMPVGALRLSANADVGSRDDGIQRQPIAYYRSELRWTGEAGFLTVDLSHSDTGDTTIRRGDVIASLNVNRWELAGGGWVTHGYIAGGEPGMWTSVGIPTGRELLLTVGVDRASVDWISRPSWRGTLTVRKRFSLPLPFAGRFPLASRPEQGDGTPTSPASTAR
jgi:hypothetical protein